MARRQLRVLTAHSRTDVFIDRQDFSDPDLPRADHVFFSLAGCNAGPKRIKRLRELA